MRVRFQNDFGQECEEEVITSFYQDDGLQYVVIQERYHHTRFRILVVLEQKYHENGRIHYLIAETI